MYMVQRRNNPDAHDIWLKKKRVSAEKKTEMFSFNATAGLMICVDGARTHLLVSCFSTARCGDKEVHDQARVMFYSLTLLVPSLSS